MQLECVKRSSPTDVVLRGLWQQGTPPPASHTGVTLRLSSSPTGTTAPAPRAPRRFCPSERTQHAPAVTQPLLRHNTPSHPQSPTPSTHLARAVRLRVLVAQLVEHVGCVEAGVVAQLAGDDLQRLGVRLDEQLGLQGRSEETVSDRK